MSLYTHIVTARFQSKEPNMQEIDRVKSAELDTNPDAIAQGVALHKLNMNTCFGCAHADTCFLSPVTGLFTVRLPQGDANCIAYDLFKQKKFGE